MKKPNPSMMIPGINQKTLATLLGISPSLLSLWFNGKRSLPNRALKILNEIQLGLIRGKQQKRKEIPVHPETARRQAEWEKEKKQEAILNKYKLTDLTEKLQEMRETNQKTLEYLAILDKLIADNPDIDFQSPVYLCWDKARIECLHILLKTDIVYQEKLTEKINRLKQKLGMEN
jgi:transcriptional regulator with XRE-family HTH domain